MAARFSMIWALERCVGSRRIWAVRCHGASSSEGTGARACPAPHGRAGAVKAAWQAGCSSMLASLALSRGWRAALQGARRTRISARWRDGSAWGVGVPRNVLFCRGAHRQNAVRCFAIPWTGSLSRSPFSSKPCPDFKQEPSQHRSTEERPAPPGYSKHVAREHGQGTAPPGHSKPETGDPGQGTAPPIGSNSPPLSDLYENPWTIPNLLSMTRIGLSPLLGCLIVEEDFNLALGIFALAGATDMLDGYIARNWPNQKSVLGSALDPLADKILISVMYVCLTYTGLIPVLLTAMIVLRDIVLIAAVFYVRFKTLPPPKTVSRYFNPCYATAQLKPTFISKLNTAFQLILVAASLAAPVFNYVDSVYLQTLWCITAFTTAASAYSYYHYGRETVNILNK